MFSKKNQRGLRHLPLSLALAGILAGGAMPAFAADANTLETCTADDRRDCNNPLAGSAYLARWQAPTSAVTPFAGEFAPGGAGISIATDKTSEAVGVEDIAIGNHAKADGGAKGGVAVGNESEATAEASTALGNNAKATHKMSVALGAESQTSGENEVSLGNSTLQRRIVNMAAGLADNDAVNVAQLRTPLTALGGRIENDGKVVIPQFDYDGEKFDTVQDVFTKIGEGLKSSAQVVSELTNSLNDGTQGLIRLDNNKLTVAAGLAGDTIDFSGQNNAKRKLTGVADGNIAADSSDAVNGTQLKQFSDKVGEHTASLTQLEQDVADLGAPPADGLVAIDPATNTISIGAAAAGTQLDIAGKDGARKLTGVANGDISANSTEAVNGGQLFTVQEDIGAIKGEVDNAKVELKDIQDKYTEVGAGRVVTYTDTEDGSSLIKFAGDNGTIISNVGAGNIAQGSTDGINGGQLWQAQKELTDRTDWLQDRLDAVPQFAAGDGSDNGSGDVPADLGGQRLTNVGDGVEDTDAANLGQVKSAAADAVQQSKDYADASVKTLNDSFEQYKSSVSDRFRQLDRRVDRIGAMSMANTQMAMNAGGVEGGNGRVAMGVGVQNSRTALSVGYAAQTSDRTRVSFGASFSGAEASVGAGAGFDL